MSTTKKGKLKFLYVAWGFLECLGFGGLIFGWGSFVYVLKDEGLYRELCENTTTNESMDWNTSFDCPERDSKLELVFTIGSLCGGLGSFVFGQINFTFGMRVSRILASLFFMCGAFIVAFTTNDLPWLIFPGMAFVAFGGMAMILTNVQLSNMFPVGAGAVVGLICGAFDSSSGIQLMVKHGYEHDISRKTSYLILACTHVLTFISTFFFLPKDYVHPLQEEYIVNQEIDLQKSDLNDIPKEAKQESIQQESVATTEKAEGVHQLIRTMFSSTFSLHVLWLCLVQLRFFYTLGSINKTLNDQLILKNKVSSYTNIMLYIMMGGLVASPLAGAFLEMNISLCKNSKSSFSKSIGPTIIPIMMTSTFGVLLSVLLIIESPSLLYYIFVLILIYRSFLYTMANAFIIRFFPSVFIGSLIGVATVVSGVFGLLQHALFEWSFKRNPREVNIFLVVFTSLSYIHPIWQWVACRRAERKT